MRRDENASFETIADALGVSVSTAHRDVQLLTSQAAERLEERATEALVRDLDRLDELEHAYAPVALSGDVAAAGVVLRCVQQRQKILNPGTQAPAVAVQINQSNSPAIDFEQFAERMERALVTVAEICKECPPELEAGADPAEAKPKP